MFLLGRPLWFIIILWGRRNSTWIPLL